MRALRIPLLSLLFVGLAAMARAEVALVMVQQPGCVWCARWNSEIAPIYPKTPEGAAAPLRRIELREPLPEGIALDRPAQFTPTFVLLVDGHEAGRIEGYPGQDFFWGLLDRMLTDAGIVLDGPPVDQ